MMWGRVRRFSTEQPRPLFRLSGRSPGTRAMNTPIRQLILSLFSVCALTLLVGPSRARGDLQLTLDSSNPPIHSGAIFDIVIDIKNTSTTDTLTFQSIFVVNHFSEPSGTLF